MELWRGIESCRQEHTAQRRSRVGVFTGPIISDLDPVCPRPGVTKDVPPLGRFRTFQTPIRDIEELTGLNLDQLIAVDRMQIVACQWDGTTALPGVWDHL
jgi:endonuclease G